MSNHLRLRIPKVHSNPDDDPTTRSLMDAHRVAVRKISHRISLYNKTKTPFRLHHGGSTNSTKQVSAVATVDTSTLNHVLRIDTLRKTCLVEPNVPMDALVDACLLHALVPPVIPEFPGITTGGAFAGTAGESSGFKYGFFDRNVNWVEVVLPTGEVVDASRGGERKDLFEGTAGSFGTIAITTLLELRLMDAKKYVHLKYLPTTDVAGTLSLMGEETESPSNDFVDAILFAKDRGVVVTGKITTDLPVGRAEQTFHRPGDPWFYLHAKDMAFNDARNRPIVDVVPLRDYLFRYDRGAFWMGSYAFQYFWLPFNRITRWLLDPFMHTRVMYHALHASNFASHFIIQDLLLPAGYAQEFIEYVDHDFGFYPIWLCPFRVEGELALRPLQSSQDHNQPETRCDSKEVKYVNVGVWGPGSRSFSKFITQNRQLESKVRELGGIKWLYAKAFYTQDEFEAIYDQTSYNELRKKYGAEHLPSVYEKTRTDLTRSLKPSAESWSGWAAGFAWDVPFVQGGYGVWKTIRDGVVFKGG